MAMKMKNGIEVEMEFDCFNEIKTMPCSMKLNSDRETKNTYRFSEIAKGKPPMIGNLYIQKWALPNRASKIKVSIEVIE